MLTLEDVKEISSIEVSIKYNDGSCAIKGFKPNIASLIGFGTENNLKKMQPNEEEPSNAAHENDKMSNQQNDVVFESKAIQDFPQASSHCNEDQIWVDQKNTDREGLCQTITAESENLRFRKLSPYDDNHDHKKNFSCYGGLDTTTQGSDVVDAQKEPLCLAKGKSSTGGFGYYGKKPQSVERGFISFPRNQYDMKIDYVHGMGGRFDYSRHPSLQPYGLYDSGLNPGLSNYHAVVANARECGFMSNNASTFVSPPAVIQTNISETGRTNETVMVGTKSSPTVFLHKGDGRTGEQEHLANANGIQNEFLPIYKHRDVPYVKKYENVQAPHKFIVPFSNAFQPLRNDGSATNHHTIDVINSRESILNNGLKTVEGNVEMKMAQKRELPTYFVDNHGIEKRPRKRKITVQDERERAFVCSYPNCLKSYLKASHLKAHTRLHTGRENK